MKIGRLLRSYVFVNAVLFGAFGIVMWVATGEWILAVLFPIFGIVVGSYVGDIIPFLSRGPERPR